MIGEKLVQLRKEKKRTQQEVADYLGVTRPAYTAYEKDSRNPDYETLKKIATYFNVTTDYLLGNSDIKNPEEITYAGIKNDEYAALTPYQKEVMDFFMNSESLSFHDKPENLLDALEEFEIFYEMLKKREERKK
ncbi:helix-turn-helix domain-containing protein [Kurthia huakuii]|uniref:helix-turn-helix domain-containing protein n=1 Tax=Kurthia huakuii TaxID=1421019 RepID=UPI0004984F7E|nr:helix-turn-helix domain-containing protein [Kurthia huakuii]MBM7699331.1 transcriptional regulator with XRE-family HTH domain [Kurthia huakuii]